MAAFDHYQLQFDNEDTFASPMYDVNLTAPEYTIPSNLSLNTGYYWRVRAFNTSGITNGWSALGMFRVPLTDTSLVSPTNGTHVMSLRPTFDWTDVPGAGYYTIEIAKNKDFTPVVASEISTTSSITLPEDLPPAQTLYWKVRAEGANGPTKWTETRSFTTPNPPGVPVLKSPNNGMTTTDYLPTFKWNQVAVPRTTTLDHYQIQISTNAAFTLPTIDVDVIGSANPNYVSAIPLTADTQYYWRVRAVNTSTEVSSWSEVHSFNTPGTGIVSDRPRSFTLNATLPVPLIASPSNGSSVSDTQPTLIWNIIPGATGYIVQASTDSGFASSFLVSATTVDARYVVLKERPFGTVIYWRVLTINGNSFSNWSATANFRSP